MGYTTDFEGCFHVNPPLDAETAKQINGIARTRRMKRDTEKLAKMLNITVEEATKKYGVEGEFYFNPDTKQSGQERDDSITDFNQPPKTQPGLWLQWVYNEDLQCIEWDGGEKFYLYEEWLNYLIANFLEPRGYSVDGRVYYKGEYEDDKGSIVCVDNNVSMSSEYKTITFEELKEKSDEFKTLGNKMFEKKQYQMAAYEYSQGVTLLQENIKDFDLTFVDDDDEEEQIDEKRILQTQYLVPLFLNLGAAHFESGSYDYAIASCDDALKLDVKNVKAYYRRAKASFAKGSIIDAKRDIEKALSFSPNHKELLELQKIISDKKEWVDQPDSIFKGIFK
jgi:tetratricopeptide (TPR) repeat protein